MIEKPWNTPSLNIGESIAKEFDGGSMAVDHIDRRNDPYAAAVVLHGRVVYTGLHASLSDARQTCEQKVRDQGVAI